MSERSIPPSGSRRFSWKWLASRLFPRGPNLIFVASYVILLFVLVEYILDPTYPRGPVFVVTILALAGLLVINILWNDLRSFFSSILTGDLALISGSVALTLITTWGGIPYLSIYLIFMVVAEIHAMLPLRPAVGFTIVLVGAWLVLIGRLGMPAENFASLLGGLVIGLIFTITLSQVLNLSAAQTERANQLLNQLQLVNAELVAARQKEKDLAVAEERVRVARDLHDGLGHHLTALSIQLQAIEKVVRNNPEMAVQAAHNAREEVQAALKEVRHSVAALREAPVDILHLPQTIARLVVQAGERTGLRTEFLQEGETVPLSAAAAMTLYRTAQEGLTNIQKHAPQARQIDVRLAYAADQVTLSLRNDGPASGSDPQTGFGLAGLAERAALLGGSFTRVTPPGGGFLIEIKLPCAGGDL